MSINHQANLCISLWGTTYRSCWQENTWSDIHISPVRENSNMPQEISLKRGKQENNSLALFTDISQESPVIRNAVAQSMTSSSLLFLTPLSSSFFFFLLVALTQSQLLFPHLSSAACCHAFRWRWCVSRSREKHWEWLHTWHNYIALPSLFLGLISTLPLFHSHEPPQKWGD